jgi:hypothetical protein
MTTTRKSGRNSSSISIRKAHPQNVLSDTNEHEKSQTATLSIEGLGNIGHIVRAIKARINDSTGRDHDNTATCEPLGSGSRTTTGPMGREDTDGAKKEK